MGILPIEVESMMMLTAKRLRIAMKPLNVPGWMERYSTMFNWRIRVVLEAGKWAPVFTIDIMSRTLASYTTWRATANLLTKQKWEYCRT